MGQGELQKGQQVVQDSVTHIHNQLGELARVRSEKQLHRAPAMPMAAPADTFHRDEPNVTTPAFWRKPDPTILYINVHEHTQIARTAFVASTTKLLFEAGTQASNASVVGDELDDRFDLQFVGDAQSAACWCLQFYQSLSLGRGRHKPTEASAPDKSVVKFYINIEKNGASIKK